jgi:hypothetical protein
MVDTGSETLIVHGVEEMTMILAGIIILDVHPLVGWMSKQLRMHLWIIPSPWRYAAPE